MMERKNLESAAAHYSYLRGLFWVPVGILFILAGMSNLEWGPLRHTWVFAVAVLVAGAAGLLITRYYNQNYGRVIPSTKAEVRTVVGAIVNAAVVGGAVQADWSLGLPVLAIGAATALITLAYYAISVGLRAHHVIIWGAVLVAALLPVWGEMAPGTKVNVGLIVIGAAAVVTGIFDHGALKRTFGPSKGVKAENGNAGA